MSASLKLSLRLQDIAQSLDDVLLDVAGERIGFVHCECLCHQWREDDDDER